MRYTPRSPRRTTSRAHALGAAVAAASAAAASLSMIATPVATAAVPGLDPPPVVSGPTTPLFSPTYMGGDATSLVQALTVARSFDVLAIGPTQRGYITYLPQMRAANPNLKVYVYVNGTNSFSNDPYPEDAYSHGAQGQRIFPLAFKMNYLMDPSSPDWVSAVASTCQERAAAIGADGCFLDTVGPAPTFNNYDSSTPINPATGAGWTRSDWLAAVDSMITSVEAANPGLGFIGNGLVNGQNFYASSGPTSPLLGVTSGGMSEMFLRDPGQPGTVYPKQGEWLQDVQMLGASQGTTLTVTKLWSGETPAEVQAWSAYSLATFLLGDAGNDYYGFLPDSTASGPTETTPYENVQIGQPAGPFAEIDGVYQRAYTGGLVVVNPTKSAVTFPIGAGSYTTLEGATVSGSMTLAPNSGDVLTTVTAGGPAAVIGSPVVTPTTDGALVTVTVDPSGSDTTVRAEVGGGADLYSGSSAAVVVPAALGPSTVTLTVKGLKTGAGYHFRVTADNAGGAAASPDGTFTTVLPAPSVDTGSASASAAGSLSFTGKLSSNGLDTTSWFEYGTTTAYGQITPAVDDGTAKNLAVSSVVSGLPSGAVVHYRLVASNSTGTSYGADHSFVTLKAPLAITGGWTAGFGGVVTLSAKVDPQHEDTQVTFSWGASSAFGGGTQTVTVPAGSKMVTVTTQVPAPAAGTFLYYGVSATNPAGATTGATRSFRI